MAKMGYIMGAGLGKNGEGRIVPVEATVLPKGKSLGKYQNNRTIDNASYLYLFFILLSDHCMSIKNTALIQNAKKKNKQQMRLERSMKKSYEKSLEKPPDVFSFLNSNLSKWVEYVAKLNFYCT